MSVAPCSCANRGSSARSSRFERIHVKMIRRRGVRDRASRRTRLSVSRAARRRSHFAGTRIFSYVACVIPSIEAATVATRASMSAFAVGSVMASRFVGNQRSGTP